MAEEEGVPEDRDEEAGGGQERGDGERAGEGADPPLRLPACGSRSGHASNEASASAEAAADKSADEGRERLRPAKHRDAQVARTGGRKLFDKKRRKVFLEWFAATANVTLSAEKAGVNYRTAFKHRMNDERFAEAWDRAAEQGVARVKARLIETKAKETPIGIDGDLDAPELEARDPHFDLQLIHALARAEPAAGGRRRQGRRPRVASNAEVKTALLKALKAFEGRVKARPGRHEPSGEEGDK